MSSSSEQIKSPDVIPKQRLLGSAENGFMMASQRFKGHTKIGEVLHLQGPHISLEVLTVAINNLQRRHPVLRSRLQTNPEKPNSYLLEEDTTLQPTIREIPRKRTENTTFWRQEWREREKGSAVIGQGLAEFWLLQDPNDDVDDKAPREIVVICEHSVCDGLSLSTVAHELLIALSGSDDNLFLNSLNWPLTMEKAIKRSLSKIGKMKALSKFILTVLYARATKRMPIARIPITNVDFPLTDMADHCHTEICYSVLNKTETQKLVEKCRQAGVTVTSAISSAILCAASTLVTAEGRPTATHLTMGADTRRRCTPSVPNHDLSYHVSAIMSFIMPTRDMPTSSEGTWELARSFGRHINTSINTGQILALGLLLGRIYRKNLDSPDLSELPTCALSSWDILPFREQYGRWKLVGMTPFMNMICGVMPFMTVQTVNGILTIMYVGNESLIPLNILERLRDETMQKLHQMMED